MVLPSLGQLVPNPLDRKAKRSAAMVVPRTLREQGFGKQIPDHKPVPSPFESEAQQLSKGMDGFVHSQFKKIVKIEPTGETYLAHFLDSHKIACISKLKINEVQEKSLIFMIFNIPRPLFQKGRGNMIKRVQTSVRYAPSKT
jgi:hypothetical protein